MNRSQLACLLICLLPLPGIAAPLTHDQRIMFFGRDDRVRVDVDKKPWTMIGQVLTKRGVSCTGTLVAPDVVVTAAHCFATRPAGVDPAVSFTIGLQGDRYTERVGVKALYANPVLLKGIQRRTMMIPKKYGRHDFAFLRLARPIGNTYGFMPVYAKDADQLDADLEMIGNKVTQAGYPSDTDDIMMAHKDCKTTGFYEDGRLAHRCDTLEGDSGSPLFARIGNTLQLIAIQSSAPVPAQRDLDDNYAVPAPLFYTQLTRFIAGKR